MIESENRDASPCLPAGKYANISTVRETKYSELIGLLKNEILSGRYGTGKPFPSVRALARRHGVSAATAQRTLDELFHQGLISRKQGCGTFVTGVGLTRKIGLIVPDVSQTEYFIRISRELIRLADRESCSLLFGEVAGRTAKARAKSAERLIDDFIRQRVSGVIFQPIEYYEEGEAFNRRMLERLDKASIPVVLCDNGLSSLGMRYDVVGNNNVEAGDMMYRHLVAAGARRICFFMRPFAPRTHYDRLRGALVAMLPEWSGSIRKDAVLVAEPDDVAAIRRRVRSGRVDAFMCGDDETAAKLMQTLRKLGCAVPSDIQVTGFNDLHVASLLSPPLTTARVSCEQIAAAAFSRILARITRPDLPPMEIFLPVRLVERESTLRTRRKGKSKI